MNNYSYSEIQNMQQKAMARVRQMQKNTDAVLEKAQEDFEKVNKQLYSSSFKSQFLSGIMYRDI